MRDAHKEVKAYNQQVANKLKEIFTPLSEALHHQVASLTKENVCEFINNIKICLIDYQDSKYDIYSQVPPQLTSNEAAKKRILNDNEIQYFFGFLKHLNETAVLKPYNLSELLTGNFNQYLWAPTYTNLHEANNHAADTLVIPIGEYGLENSLLMLLTTLILLRFVDNLRVDGAGAELQNWEIIAAETLRGRRKAEQLADGKIIDVISTLDTLKEGIQSFQATVSSLTATKVNQMAFSDLIEHVIAERMPQKIAVKVPFSYTMPSIRQGIFFERVFNNQANTAEKLTFSNAFMEYCKETQELYRNSRVIVDNKRNPGLLGTGCPVAQKMSGYDLIGINYIGQAYLQVFNLLRDNLDLQEFKKLINVLKLTTPQSLSILHEKPDDFKVYNVNEHDRNIARVKVSEMKELSELTDQILQFWFGGMPVNKMPNDSIRQRWFAQVLEFDQDIFKKFARHITAVMTGRFIDCKRTPMQTVALVVLLDQFSRNAYRNTSEAYACDNLATKLCFEMIEDGYDLSLPVVYRWFLYMPLQHSENINHQEKSVELFSRLHNQLTMAEDRMILSGVLEHAKQHRTIIKAFGRFPSRNLILDRHSTTAELSYLSSLKPDNYYNEKYFSEHPIQKTSDNANKIQGYFNKNTLTFGIILLGVVLHYQSEQNAYNKQFISLFMIILATYNHLSSCSYGHQFSFFKQAPIADNLSKPSEVDSLQLPYLIENVATNTSSLINTIGK
jgi:uncharacterized protein (DUF924 family)